ncbi:hypothetical protein A2208_02295 [Candidatus Woesebacteria bacterium RIFOXYA1_FULL_43_16]|uniref:Uncharacterized protein n=1 Tax=Candidatus Woesebacteria bacterium GW2011_GWA1_44_23 TaxID=1618558 RepID=A0A837IBK3_9BACT|nr:MAG: hypothetical protein UW47_C0008G0002 [Candidatus Woesebacteria bacterium GW2011_GWA1_44_23]OGM76263.1 MAG: hypothetical protein A2208_02295 [Candidatus Woesebacteria bacterium RIFOXYA1_FULL_43_16]
MPTMLSEIEPNQVVTEQQILLPVAQIIDGSSYKPTQARVIGTFPTSAKSIQDLFPEQEYEEKSIQLAKKALGSLSTEFSAEQLKTVITEVEFLTESWLDEFERQIFKGSTLQELLHEKGGK